MAWDHLSINRPHLVYIILGGFTSLFMLCSSFIKERLYIGEATVATICGVIFGPHAANLINPGTWGNTDQITLEFSRIVLVVQCFAVGVELPKYYMEKHWRSVVFLLIPVMTFGWLMTSLFIWWMIPPLNWLESLCCAACVTATDPVLASSVVGKGKFAKRIPKHLRDILSAESGCNDGMAFPFIYLALYIIEFKNEPHEVAKNWLVITILYECVFGAFYGFAIGYIGRHGIKYAEKHDLVDRESFLVFYFVLALFCAGSGSILGIDDLLVGFSAGVGFSNDGWFTQKTEESHVSNVIDLLINLAYFVYLGTIIPWEQYNSPAIGTTPWRLVVIALFVIFFRRIPIMIALKPVIPDIKTWREALFAGHFGPIGVGAIFVAILARAELETESATPLASYPPTGAPNSTLVALIWPITTFLVISSIIVHGSSIAVFTLGKRINTLSLTMSYTTAGDEGPSWLNRLPRISSVSRSQAKSVGSESEADGLRREDLPPGVLPPIGLKGQLLRRQKEEDNPSRHGSRASSLIARRRKKRRSDGVGFGGPISQSAIYPQRRSQSERFGDQTSDTLTPGESPENEKGEDADDEITPEGLKDEDDERFERGLGHIQHDPEMEEIMHRQSAEEERDGHESKAERHPDKANVYQEGDNIIIENEDGEVLETLTTSPTEKERHNGEKEVERAQDDAESPSHGHRELRKRFGRVHQRDGAEGDGESKSKHKQHKEKRGPALAYQFGSHVSLSCAFLDVC
jgi:Na(+)/H(+) antiporter